MSAGGGSARAVGGGVGCTGPLRLAVRGGGEVRELIWGWGGVNFVDRQTALHTISISL